MPPGRSTGTTLLAGVAKVRYRISKQNKSCSQIGVGHVAEDQDKQKGIEVKERINGLTEVSNAGLNSLRNSVIYKNYDNETGCSSLIICDTLCQIKTEQLPCTTATSTTRVTPTTATTTSAYTILTSTITTKSPSTTSKTTETSTSAISTSKPSTTPVSTRSSTASTTSGTTTSTPGTTPSTETSSSTTLYTSLTSTTTTSKTTTTTPSTTSKTTASSISSTSATTPSTTPVTTTSTATTTSGTVPSTSPVPTSSTTPYTSLTSTSTSSPTSTTTSTSSKPTTISTSSTSVTTPSTTPVTTTSTATTTSGTATSTTTSPVPTSSTTPYTSLSSTTTSPPTSTTPSTTSKPTTISTSSTSVTTPSTTPFTTRYSATTTSATVTSTTTSPVPTSSTTSYTSLTSTTTSPPTSTTPSTTSKPTTISTSSTSVTTPSTTPVTTTSTATTTSGTATSTSPVPTSSTTPYTSLTSTSTSSPTSTTLSTTSKPTTISTSSTSVTTPSTTPVTTTSTATTTSGTATSTSPVPTSSTTPYTSLTSTTTSPPTSTTLSTTSKSTTISTSSTSATTPSSTPVTTTSTATTTSGTATSTSPVPTSSTTPYTSLTSTTTSPPTSTTLSTTSKSTTISTSSTSATTPSSTPVTTTSTATTTSGTATSTSPVPTSSTTPYTSLSSTTTSPPTSTTLSTTSKSTTISTSLTSATTPSSTPVTTTSTATTTSGTATSTSPVPTSSTTPYTSLTSTTTSPPTSTTLSTTSKSTTISTSSTSATTPSSTPVTTTSTATTTSGTATSTSPVPTSSTTPYTSLTSTSTSPPTSTTLSTTSKSTTISTSSTSATTPSSTPVTTTSTATTTSGTATSTSPVPTSSTTPYTSLTSTSTSPPTSTTLSTTSKPTTISTSSTSATTPSTTPVTTTSTATTTSGTATSTTTSPVPTSSTTPYTSLSSTTTSPPTSTTPSTTSKPTTISTSSTSVTTPSTTPFTTRYSATTTSATATSTTTSPVPTSSTTPYTSLTSTSTSSPTSTTPSTTSKPTTISTSSTSATTPSSTPVTTTSTATTTSGTATSTSPVPTSSTTPYTSLTSTSTSPPTSTTLSTTSKSTTISTSSTSATTPSSTPVTTTSTATTTSGTATSTSPVPTSSTTPYTSLTSTSTSPPTSTTLSTTSKSTTISTSSTSATTPSSTPVTTTSTATTTSGTATSTSPVPTSSTTPYTSLTSTSTSSPTSTTLSTTSKSTTISTSSTSATTPSSTPVTTTSTATTTSGTATSTSPVPTSSTTPYTSLTSTSTSSPTSTTTSTSSKPTTISTSSTSATTPSTTPVTTTSTATTTSGTATSTTTSPVPTSSTTPYTSLSSTTTSPPTSTTPSTTSKPTTISTSSTSVTTPSTTPFTTRYSATTTSATATSTTASPVPTSSTTPYTSLTSTSTSSPTSTTLSTTSKSTTISTSSTSAITPSSTPVTITSTATTTSGTATSTSPVPTSSTTPYTSLTSTSTSSPTSTTTSTSSKPTTISTSSTSATTPSTTPVTTTSTATTTSGTATSTTTSPVPTSSTTPYTSLSSTTTSPPTSTTPSTTSKPTTISTSSTSVTTPSTTPFTTRYSATTTSATATSTTTSPVPTSSTTSYTSLTSTSTSSPTSTTPSTTSKPTTISTSSTSVTTPSTTPVTTTSTATTTSGTATSTTTSPVPTSSTTPYTSLTTTTTSPPTSTTPSTTSKPTTITTSSTSVTTPSTTPVTTTSTATTTSGTATSTTTSPVPTSSTTPYTSLSSTTTSPPTSTTPSTTSKPTTISTSSTSVTTPSTTPFTTRYSATTTSATATSTTTSPVPTSSTTPYTSLTSTSTSSPTSTTPSTTSKPTTISTSSTSVTTPSTTPVTTTSTATTTSGTATSTTTSPVPTSSTTPYTSLTTTTTSPPTSTTPSTTSKPTTITTSSTSVTTPSTTPVTTTSTATTTSGTATSTTTSPVPTSSTTPYTSLSSTTTSPPTSTTPSTTSKPTTISTSSTSVTTPSTTPFTTRYSATTTSATATSTTTSPVPTSSTTPYTSLTSTSTSSPTSTTPSTTSKPTTISTSSTSVTTPSTTPVTTTSTATTTSGTATSTTTSPVPTSSTTPYTSLTTTTTSPPTSTTPSTTSKPTTISTSSTSVTTPSTTPVTTTSTATTTSGTATSTTTSPVPTTPSTTSKPTTISTSSTPSTSPSTTPFTTRYSATTTSATATSTTKSSPVPTSSTTPYTSLTSTTTSPPTSTTQSTTSKPTTTSTPSTATSSTRPPTTATTTKSTSTLSYTTGTIAISTMTSLTTLLDLTKTSISTVTVNKCEAVSCPAGSMLNITELDCLNATKPKDCKESLRLYDTKLCCFIYICPECKTESLQRKKPGDVWEENCQNCTCTNNGEKACVALPCPPVVTKPCTEPGYRAINIQNPANPCCLVHKCVCDISTCPPVTSTCAKGLKPVISLDGCCAKVSCVPEITTTTKAGKLPTTSPGLKTIMTSLGGTSTSATPECQPVCKWSEWFDVSHPAREPNGGDFETYENIKTAGFKLCEGNIRPESIACRAVDNPNISLEQIGQVVTCNVSIGLVCNNKDQAKVSELCLDYEIQILCCNPLPDYCYATTLEPPTKSMTTTSTPPTTSGSTATPASFPTTITSLTTSTRGCIINNVLYTEGQSVPSPSDKCVVYRCEKVDGQLVTLEERQTCQYKSSNDCKNGEEFVQIPDQCCGECVQKPCVVVTSNGETKTLTEGQSEPSPSDKCIVYRCEKVDGQLVTLVEKEACQYKSSNDCKKGEEFVQIPDQCCGECVQKSCVVVTSNGETKTLTEGEFYTPTDDKCKSYTCEKIDGQPVTIIVKTDCQYKSSLDCASGEEFVQPPDQCCGQCVQKSCVVVTSNGTKILNVGELNTPPDDKCKSYTCEKIDGQPVTLIAKTDCQYKSSVDCESGEEFVQPPDQCCGQCVQKSCVVVTSNGETRILNVGELYTPPDDKCKSYTCEKIDGQPVTLIAKTDCQYKSSLDCESGEEFVQPPDQCCGQCVQKSCVVVTPNGETRILNVGELYTSPDDKCKSYTCEKIDGQPVTLIAKTDCQYKSSLDCESGEEFVQSPDQCCGQCVQKSCVVVTSNGETRILNVGELYTSPDDKCKSYTCEKIDGQPVTLIAKTDCQYKSSLDCESGEEFVQSPDQCCGQCVQKSCVVVTSNGETRILNVGELYTSPDDKCKSYTCEKIDGQPVTLIAKTDCQYKSSLDCESGEEFVQPPDQCCGRCVQKSCVVVTSNGETKILNEGSSFTDDKCTSYKCEKLQGQLATLIEKETCQHKSSKDCASGEEFVQLPDQCCGQCIQTSCAVVSPSGKTESLPEGQSLTFPSDKCTSYRCEKLEGKIVTLKEKETCQYNSSKDCANGLEFVQPPDQCCGYCVQKACVVVLPNGEVQTLIEGEPYFSPDDKCTSYTCQKLERQLVTLVSKKICQYNSALDCKDGEEFVDLPDQCCGQCVKKACALLGPNGEKKILTEGQSYTRPNDKCKTYTCNNLDGQIDIFVEIENCRYTSSDNCKDGEEFVQPPDQCCGQCIQKSCALVTPFGEVKMLPEGESYTSPSDKCTSYTCEKINGQHLTHVKKEACQYNSSLDCKIDEDFVQTPDQCCGKCVQKSCVVITPAGETKIFTEGQSYTPPGDICASYLCEKLDGQIVTLLSKEICQYKSSNDCKPDEGFIQPPDQCCGRCVQNSCVVMTPNGETTLLLVGRSYTPPDDNCTTYICDKLEGQIVTFIEKENCKYKSYKDCKEGQDFDMPDGQCCGQCIQKSCVVVKPNGESLILVGGETLETDKCTSYNCERMDGQLMAGVKKEVCQYESSKDCKNGEDFVQPPDQCCGQCVQKFCVVTMPDGETKKLSEGQSYTSPNDNCTSYVCNKVDGQLVTLTAKETCQYTSVDDCKDFEEYITMPNRCCGACVQKFCYVYAKEGEPEKLKEGQSYTPPDEKCTTYKCENVKTQVSIRVEKEACKYKSSKDCKDGEEFVQPPDQCCGLCVQTSCAVVTPNGETKVLTEGQSYTPPSDKCTSYVCNKVDGQLVTLTAKETCQYTSSDDCKEFEEYTPLPDRCCGSCVQKFCYVLTTNGETKILKNGQSYTPPDEKCTTYKCENVKTQVSILVEKEACKFKSLKDCKDGEEFVQPADQCCGRCVQTSCVVVTPSGETKILTEGRSYTPPSDKCTSYICEVVDGQLITLVEKETCQYNSSLDCKDGEEYVQSPVRCCGECVQKSCVVVSPSGETKLVKEGTSLTFPSDKCTAYRCEKVDGQLITLVEKETCQHKSSNDCENGQELVQLPDQCCGQCVQTSCAVLSPEGETKILKEGQSITFENDRCTSHVCDTVDGKIVTLVLKENCKYKSISDCQNGEEFEQIPDQCCGQCVQKACVVTPPNEGLTLLKEGQSYISPRDNCTTYLCEFLDGKFVTLVKQEACQYNSSKDCKRDEEFVRSPDQCCGQCIQRSCAVIAENGTITLLKEGERLPSVDNKCAVYMCNHSNDRPMTYLEVQKCVNDQCRPGETYEVPANECCGKCVQESCVVYQSLGTPIFLEPGKSLPDPENVCNTYVCKKAFGELVTEVETKVCKYKSNKDCNEGEVYTVSNNECCGQCLPVACNIVMLEGNNVTLKAGESMYSPGDKCISYNCMFNNGVFTSILNNKTCEQVNPEDCETGTIEVSDDGCCSKCKAPKNCRLEFGLVTLTSGDCTLDKILPYCTGACPTPTMKNATEPECKCCKHRKSRKESVTLPCKNGKSISYKYDYIESCGCTTKVCE
ncbi:uncharacterized protein [Engystomops pustulosus]|uniref:uncharacterized protein n=1 Tax=Engystomops pustulosus TaxID=76066 RepID=UPI003AFB39DE